MLKHIPSFFESKLFILGIVIVAHKEITYHMKATLLLVLFLIVTSCIPTAIAPDLENGKIIRAKKFKRKLPNRYAYIFTDSKKADEFYHYINTKYNLNYQYVQSNVPVIINEKQFYISFYETDKKTQTINLIPILIDAKRESNGNEAVLRDIYSSEWNRWYVILLITAENFQDGLNPSYSHYKEVKEFAESLKDEYYRTSNYNQTILQASNK
ncbi:hypothetical protein [Dokdonia sp. Hel_I_53]|uniref:hypothetical protein n=1 Tax=Dokdonia sp. Hel_I_53 TaxID=1566287 RepID=UPI00119ACDC8|nr:hypothetical protein [Dokdonia sp. Hel_I_53]TVZ52123.1 hypothetical protein OD90_1287 [Dokdonia sp. Hel_I_53]